jgi:hypothetical protein
MVARISCCHAKSRVHVDLEKIGDNNSATRSEEMRSKINLFFDATDDFKCCVQLYPAAGPLSFESLSFREDWIFIINGDMDRF